VKSQFLDHQTFEPYAGEALIPGFVRLREMPDYAGDGQFEGRVRGRHRLSTSTMSPMLLGQDPRPCMKALIESGQQLDGAEGHDMRVAIATEAWHIGMPVEKAVELFRSQNDFDPETSRKKLDEIYARGYYPFACETLLDKSRSLVSSYCNSCPRNQLIQSNTAWDES